jgi:glycosyltransferase involved in cell wall biosynthesis
MKVSVAFIVFNGGHYLRTQLDSIIAQTQPVDEIIVCDDASSDMTKEILEKYKMNHPNLFYIQYNQQNIGATKNIQKAVQACTGNIILLADQDDYWEPNKVATLINWFNQNPNMNGVFTNGNLMNANGILDNKYALWDAMSFPYKNISNYYGLKTYISTVENCVTGATLAIRNNLNFLQQPFPLIKHLVHDRWLAINLAEHNTLGFLNEKLIRYRIHSNQAIGGITENIEKYIELNDNLMEDEPNRNNNINSFKELRFILNKIEINLHIQIEISKIEKKDFDNTNYITILKNKHKIYTGFGLKKWPLLTNLRKIKKLFLPTVYQ